MLTAITNNSSTIIVRSLDPKIIVPIINLSSKKYRSYSTSTTRKNNKLIKRSQLIIHSDTNCNNNNNNSFLNLTSTTTTTTPYTFRNNRTFSTQTYQQQQYQQHQQQQQIINKELDEKQSEVVGTSLLPVVNKLQEITSLIGTEITLPQIVVIGSQSSGKSSVLENLVGRDFLPRGSGLVTRRPLMLQLNRTTDGSKSEWGEFAHTGEKRYSFDEIKSEIEKETARVAGKNKDISSDPIILRIFSPNVIPLTMVDTPGITRVPIGDQPTNIEEKIRNMVLDYISNPNSIILAITSANQDIVTSDALKLAKEVDPQGKRTIGVLTKLDLMDKGTDALDILLGGSIPLKYGFVGIINRSQQDIQNHKSIGTMLREEETWFGNHPIYKRISDQLGTQYLAQKCNKILTKHIRECLPNVKNQIRTLIRKYEDELEKYGEPIPDRPGENARLLIDILNKFSIQFRADLEGMNDELTTNHINGGARIRYIFSQSFKTLVEKPFDWMSDQQLRVALRNSSGIRPTMFIPQKTFDTLTKIQIEKLKDPALQCADLVLDEMLRILTHVDSNILSRFPVLRDRIVEVANNVLRKLLNPTNKMISDMVDAECSYINTSHPVYVSELNKLLHANTSQINVKDEHLNNDTFYRKPSDQQQQQQQQQSGFFGRIFGSGTSNQQQSQSDLAKKQQDQTNKSNLLYGMDEKSSEEERKQIHLLRRLLMSYYEIAQFNVQENTMKIISLMLIDRSKDILQRELASVLYNEDSISGLLRENETVVARRRECLHKLEILKKAKKSLSVTEMKDLPLQFY
eukprot:gene7730-9506_t